MSITFYAQRCTGDWSLGTGRIEYEGEGVNMSSANAADVLRLLGFVHELDDEERALFGDEFGDTVPDEAGDVDPADFDGRILLARGLLDVATDDEHGVPVVDYQEPGRVRWVECGRRPGYLAEKLDVLAAVAADAKANGGLVVWC